VSFVSSTGGYRRTRPDPITRIAGAFEEERRTSRSGHLGTGTLACSRCDAPVALGGSVLTPTDLLTCPFCRHRGAVREFLSLAMPTRPARVEVRIAITRRGRRQLA
jgi:hypothetical protein